MGIFNVDYDLDIKFLYEKLFAAEYEKANIWPQADAERGLEILEEELTESASAVDALQQYTRDILLGEGYIPIEQELKELEGYTVSAICELLQVIAVCRKYSSIFGEALREDINDDNQENM